MTVPTARQRIYNAICDAVISFDEGGRKSLSDLLAHLRDVVNVHVGTPFSSVETMSHRLRLRDRRELETIAIEHEGQRFKVGLGRDTPGSPVVEVWLNAQKANSQIDVLASDGAILMSMLIQYGCPAEAIIKSMKHSSDGSPASPLGVAAQLVAETFKKGE